MAPTVGGSFFWHSGNIDNYNEVKVKDFNISIDFCRDNNSYDNSVNLYNGELKTGLGQTAGNGKPSVAIKSSYESTIFKHILSADGDMKTFSKEDYQKLLANDGKNIWTSNGGNRTEDQCAYGIKVIDKDRGIVEVTLKERLADGTPRDIGSKFKFDIETEFEIKMNAQNEAKFKEREENRKAAFELVKEADGFEKPIWDKRYIDGKRQDCLLVSVVKRQTIREIEEKFGLNEGTLIKYNPALKDLEPGLLDRLLGNDAKISDIKLLIPAFELNQREN